MNRRTERERRDFMEYPFGFGFELMKNPRAMNYFFALDDERKRALMRSISEIDSREQMRGFLAGLCEPSKGKTP